MVVIAPKSHMGHQLGWDLVIVDAIVYESHYFLTH